MDTREPTIEERLLHQSERQTKALESINLLVMFLLIIVVLGGGLWALLAAVG